MIRRDKQTALPYPAKTGKMCREFLGEDAADILVVSPSGCRYREGTMSGSLELVCHPDTDLVEHLVDDIVAVMPVQNRSFRILIRQEIYKTVLQNHTGRDRSRVPGNPFPSSSRIKS